MCISKLFLIWPSPYQQEIACLTILFSPFLANKLIHVVEFVKSLCTIIVLKLRLFLMEESRSLSILRSLIKLGLKVLIVSEHTSQLHSL